jgi:hypothetical protein
MVESGLQPSDPAAPRITYKVGNAEDLQAAGVGAGEQGVDLAVAGVSLRLVPPTCFSSQARRHIGSTTPRSGGS